MKSSKNISKQLTTTGFAALTLLVLVAVPLLASAQEKLKSNNQNSFQTPSVVQAPPANDNFANAQDLGNSNTNGTGNVNGATLEASKETGEPNHAGNPGGHSVWYKLY